MKTVIIFLSYLFTLMASAQTGTPVELTKRNKPYVTYKADLYDKKTGKSFPYRVSIKRQVDVCATYEYLPTVLNSIPFSKVIIFQPSGFALSGMDCGKLKTVSQSFDYPVETDTDYLEIIIESEAEVSFERLN